MILVKSFPTKNLCYHAVILFCLLSISYFIYSISFKICKNFQKNWSKTLYLFKNVCYNSCVVLKTTTNNMRSWRNWQTRKTKDLVVDLDLGSSSLLDRTTAVVFATVFGRLAQLVEQLTLNQWA